MIDDASVTLDMDDGATEVVTVRPARRALPPVDVSKVARARAGGRLAAVRAAGSNHVSNFVMLRTPLGAAKIALAHASVYHGLWRVWTAKRIRGEDDPGATVAEIVEAEGLAEASVRNALESLTRNRVVRVITTHVGYQGTRARFYPTEIGIQAFAMAEVLGPGAFVQVGRTSKAWRSRSQDEPADLFRYAALVRGGSLPPISETL